MKAYSVIITEIKTHSITVQAAGPGAAATEALRAYGALEETESCQIDHQIEAGYVEEIDK